MAEGSPRAPLAVAIAGVGLATAQGAANAVLAASVMVPPAPIPGPPMWRHNSVVYRPALGVDATLTGSDRLTALARAALDDCLPNSAPPAGTPLLIASCNGGAAAWDAASWRRGFDVGDALEGTAWRGQRLPVASAACASGLHALYLATRYLAAGARQAVVLGVDIETPPARDAFETLRILASDEVAPWQPARAGFVLGEAAVALRIVRAEQGDDNPRLSGPVLGYDLDGADGLDRVLGALDPAAPALVLGQATGPSSVDAAELAALASRVARAVPLSSAIHQFGHTLGASGLLSVALGALAFRAPIPAALSLPAGVALDGRSLVTGAVRSRETIVVCRALGGACAACIVGPQRPTRNRPRGWREPAPPPPIRDRELASLARGALSHRPAEAPDLLVVCLDAPFVPPDDALVGGRILPSSILEMTPGFAAQIVARGWGFTGPAVCMLAPPGTEAAIDDLVRACRIAGDAVHRIDIRGDGKDRHVSWNV